jgi:hypothetical protein
MPKQRLKITKTEYQDNRARVLRLKEMDVPTGSVRGALRACTNWHIRACESTG